MGILGGLQEADGLSVLTATPPLGLRRSPLLEVQDFFKSHSPHLSVQDLPTATAFLQASRRPLGLAAAASASEWFGSAPKTLRPGRGASDCRAVCLAPGTGCSSHEDFLFGGQPQVKQSVISEWIVAARMTYAGDPNDERLNEEEKGWSKMIPRSLGFFTVLDMISAGVIFATRNYVCDVPLRTWLLGGIMLGGPADLVIKGLAWALKPRFKIYRFSVVNVREDAPENFELSSLKLYNEFGHEIAGGGRTEYKSGNSWIVSLDYPQMISSYQIITSQLEASKDPVSWKLVASNNNLLWTLIDEKCHRQDSFVPLTRNTASDLETEFEGTDDTAFRQAFLAELIATGTSLAWLTLGSAWIARGSESCVDSAPELWYYSFFMACLTWSCLGTVTIGLIVSAVAMIALGVKTPQ